jgi:hypothetical protein
VPNTRNVPLFSKRGEFEGTAKFGPYGKDFQAAASVTNHLALMANYASHSDIDSTRSRAFVNYKYKFLEGGIGYFWRDDHYAYEIFTGYGKGDGLTYDYFHEDRPDLISREITGKYERYFIQPSIGFRKSIVDLGFTFRFSFVNFSELRKYKTERENPGTLVFFEPATTLKINFARNRFFMLAQGGVNLNMTLREKLGHSNISLSGGIGVRLGAKDPDLYNSIR